MSFAGPNPERDGIRPSKVLSKEEDIEVREGILDGGFGYNEKDGVPQIIIGNTHTGCLGAYFPRRNGREAMITFDHCSMEFATTCGCLIKGKAGESTQEFPEGLVEHGIKLVMEHGVETKFATIIMIKLFLGFLLYLLSIKDQGRPEKKKRVYTSKKGNDEKRPPWRGP
ncbi:hypothetical protein LQW54_003061 [Pestalotiopsis sp. IQ-011]